MNRNQFFVMVILVSCAVLTVSCKKDDDDDSVSTRDACETYGQCIYDWYGSYYDFNFDASECADEVEEESASCASAFRDAMRCLDRSNCNADDCESQAEDMMNECDSGYDYYDDYGYYYYDDYK